jgi:hypothetical protein
MIQSRTCEEGEGRISWDTTLVSTTITSRNLPPGAGWRAAEARVRPRPGVL